MYVGSNAYGSGNESISGFTVDSSGTAQPISGSPFTGPSSSEVVNSSYLFATDGTNIETYSIGSGGTLQQASSINGTMHNQIPNGSAVGNMTLDRSGQTLYAAELNFDGADNDAYSYFGIGSGGNLSFLNSSSIDTNYHTPLSFSQSNQFAYGEGCYHFTPEIFGFSRNGDGTLTSINTNAILPPTNNPGTMWCPDDSAASAGNYLALVYFDLSVQNGPYYLATYTINSDGTLGLVTNSEVTTPFTGEAAVSFDPTGQYLAMAGQGGIQVYQINANGIFTPVGAVQQPSVAFTALSWDNSNHLYAIAASGLYIFNSDNGALTLDGSPYPVTNPGSLAVLPQS